MKIRTLDKVDGVAEVPADRVSHPVAEDGTVVAPKSEPLVRRGIAYCHYRLPKGQVFDKVPDGWARELIGLKLARKA